MEIDSKVVIINPSQNPKETEGDLIKAYASILAKYNGYMIKEIILHIKLGKTSVIQSDEVKI